MKLLLRLYPRRWRDRYLEEVEVLLEESPTHHPLDALNLARGAMDAHWRAGSLIRKGTVILLFLGLDAIIGWLNYQASDDVQPVAAVLILSGFGLGLWQPRWAWAIVPALWIAVPISSIAGFANNYHPGLVKPAPLYETVVALIPLGVGVGFGAGLAWVLRRGGRAAS